MRRPTSLPVLIQVGALAAAAVIASQAVAFAVVVLSPDPRPDGFSISAAADALRGRPAVTQDGRDLRRRISDAPVSEAAADPMAVIITSLLARELGTTQDRVRVRLDLPRGSPVIWRSTRPRAPQGLLVEHGTDAEAAAGVIQRGRGAAAGDQTFVTVLPAPAADDAPPVRVRGMLQFHQSLGIRSDRLTFGPFSAAWRMDDGRWATVEPPRDLLSPWQQRILLALAISALILAPLVWWMARRLTRPIRVFADAAERLGADPDAEPLKPSGPTEVRTAIHAFNDMQASIRAHMRQRTQTIAAIAHDLRTPLTRLRFRAEQTPEALRDRMVGDIEEMDALIGQAMAFVRGEATTDRRERFDLGLLVQECAQGFSETGALVTLLATESLPVEADRAALRRAVANLIDNALKFAGKARVRAFAAESRAVIEVEDDGPGLGEDELEIVFEPFHRGERSRNRETGGAGLGLAVARQAARAAGGDVRLVNRPEGGLAARLTVPLTD